MNTDLTEKLEQLEAYLGIDYYGDANYVMELLKEAKNLAINYTRCCETLKDKKKITFDEWLGKWDWERIGSSYTFKRGESYTDAESLMISYKKEYSL